MDRLGLTTIFFAGGILSIIGTILLKVLYERIILNYSIEMGHLFGAPSPAKHGFLIDNL